MNLTDVTPNLIVADMARSTAFYRDVLGFSVVTTVPDQAPFAFTWLQRGGVNVFLNSRESARADLDAWGARPIGGTAGLFMTIEADSPAEGIDRLFASIDGRVPVLMALKNQFYGMREFALEDPDGYVIFFAQRMA